MSEIMSIKRMTITVPEDIQGKLEVVAGGERKKGEWLTRMVEAAYEGGQILDNDDFELLRYQLIGVIAELNKVKKELKEVQAQLAGEKQLI